MVPIDWLRAIWVITGGQTFLRYSFFCQRIQIHKNKSLIEAPIFLPRKTLITNYKTFVRPNLDYDDILYNQAFINFFHGRLESVLYNSCLAITRDTTRTDKEKIKSGLEFLQMCCWFRKRYLFFFLIFKSDQLKYLFNIIPCKVYHTLQKILIIFAFHQKDKNIRLGLSIDNFEHVNNNFKINAATIEFILYTTGFVKQLL